MMKRKRKKLLTNKTEDFHSSFAHPVTSATTLSIVGLEMPPIEQHGCDGEREGREGESWTFRPLDLLLLRLSFTLIKKFMDKFGLRLVVND